MSSNETNIEQHGCLSHPEHDRNFADFFLLSPLKIRGLTLKNRIVLSPMCQYSSQEGFANDWHLVHLGSRALGGAGLIFTEAAAVTAQGRISPGDLGIWDDRHIDFLSRITNFIKKAKSIPAIQIAHAGRKGSCDLAWNGGASLTPEEGAWDIIAPSSLAFSDTNALPREMNLQDIQEVITAFQKAAQRAVKAGFEVIEIHAAHGYLLHQFLSPKSNKRQDAYGGNLENRMRLPLEVVKAVRNTISENTPLFIRISATDWLPDGWDIDQTLLFCKQLKECGVDLIDISSGGTAPHVKIPIGKNYQVPFAEAVRDEVGVKTGAVGLITEVEQANEIITSGKADLVFIGREFLRNPYFALKAQQELNHQVQWPLQYGYAVQRRV